jgi:hypothetical protein
MSESATVSLIPDWDIEHQIYSQINRINSVFSAFRAAEMNIEWVSLSNEPNLIFQSRTETYNNVPEYFESIKSSDPLGIYYFLIGHRDLIDIVAFACQESVRRFRKKTQLFLEVCNDEEENYLALYVRQERYQKNIIAVIDDISKKYEYLLPLRSGWFMITTDFNPPIRIL